MAIGILGAIDSYHYHLLRRGIRVQRKSANAHRLLFALKMRIESRCSARMSHHGMDSKSESGFAL